MFLFEQLLYLYFKKHIGATAPERNTKKMDQHSIAAWLGEVGQKLPMLSICSSAENKDQYDSFDNTDPTWM